MSTTTAERDLVALVMELERAARESDALILGLTEKLQAARGRAAELEAERDWLSDQYRKEIERTYRQLGAQSPPAPLQAPDPAMTLGAAAEPDAPHLGVQFENGTWALTVGGLVHNGYDYGMALALAVTVGGVVRDIDEWKEEQMALHVQVAMGAAISDH